MSKDYQLFQNPTLPVKCHAWNADRTQVCVSGSGVDAFIYGFDGTKFSLLHTLTEHTATVTSIDWCASTNMIVTCGQDRNAYVWTQDGDQWKPKIVLLRINRAATCVKWSHDGKKFAVGTGARMVSVCYFEEDNNWWVAKHIKKPIRSTILSIDWHPDNILLATGSAGFKTRIFSAYIKGVDAKPSDSTWGKRGKFGEMITEFKTGPFNGGWVHDVSFSNDGTLLAYVAHDSSLYVADSNTDDNTVTRFAGKGLPYTSVSWVSPTRIVAAGYNYMPVLFTFNAGSIEFLGDLDRKEEKKVTSSFRALDKFRNLDNKGTEAASDLSTSVKSVHQNCIVELAIHSGNKEKVAKFSTVGSDGKLVVWNLPELEKALGFSEA